MKKENLSPCYVQITQDICCSPKDIGQPQPPIMKTCILCQKERPFISEQQGVVICFIC
jgi:hypothetical protein